MVDIEKLKERSATFLRATQKLHEIENRFVGWWFPGYYLLSHSLELAVKAVIYKHTSKLPRGHNILGLLYKYGELFDFDDGELENIKKLINLNSGPGGLRYPDNDIAGDFLPSVFKGCEIITQRLLTTLERR